MELNGKSASPETHNLREFLQSELVRRCRNNRRYSLRAFARCLKLESSYLSKVLRGHRPITANLIEKVREPLALGPNEVEKFKAAVQSERKRRGSHPPAPLENFQQLTLDSFQVISDWYHYAILELTTVEQFRSDPQWIAETLGITHSDAQLAIERLLRLGLLKLREDNTFEPVENHTTTNNPFTSTAFRRLQKGILEKALAALEEIPMEERDQSTVTFATDTSLLPGAKQMIKDFRRQLAAYLQPAGRPRNSVFHLSVSLYPVARPTTVVVKKEVLQ